MRVAVRVDAGPVIGGGHAMRCLTVADELAQRGAEITFVSSEMPDWIASRIAAFGYKLARLAPPVEASRQGSDWHEPPLDSAMQAMDAGATGALAGMVDWLLVDHYLLDDEWHSAARAFAKRILVIDDLANRRCDCDLLVDETEGRSPRDYAELVPERTTVLAGAKYALLRPEFPADRPAALERRTYERAVERILISLGLTDPGSISASAAQQVLAAVPDCAIDVVVSEEAKSLPSLERLASKDPRLTIHVNTDRMAELMRNADLAIGAAGTTSWERCCLGLPTIALALAENQRSNLEALVGASAAIEVKHAHQIGAIVASVVVDTKRLIAMSEAAFNLTDGLGTVRVVDELVDASAAPTAVRA